MKLGNIEIDTKKFYLAGVICFGMVAIMNTLAFIRIFPVLFPEEIIGRAFSTIFNYALFGWFYYLYKGMPDMSDAIKSDEELAEFLKH